MNAIAAWVAAKATALFVSATGSTSLAAAQVVYATVYVGTQIAIGAALTAAAAAAVGTPDVESIKGSKKQAIPPRILAAGRRKIGGWFTLWEAKDNYAYDVLYLCEGPIEAIEEVWAHDKVLSFDGGGVGGWVLGSSEYGGGDDDLIHVEYRLGAATETAYSAMTAALPTIWTAAAGGDGCASLGADYHHAKKENLPDDFPNLAPDWSVTAKLLPVWDPRDEGADREDPATWGGTKSNLALLILHFCLHEAGMAMDWETEIAPAIDHWKGEADICDEDVALAAGGTEKRYWGSYYHAIPDDPQNTLDKLLAACDGKLLKDQHGVWRLWVGKYRAPTVILTDEDIADYDISGDPAAFDAANEVVAKFVDENHDWSLVDVVAWRDEDDIARRAKVLSLDLPLECSHSGPMSRRVGKAMLRRQLAPLRGTLVGKLSSARALGQRWVGVDLPDLGQDDAVIELEDGGKLAFSRGAVDLKFVLADATAWDWDAATEEASPTLTPRPPVTAMTPPEITSIAPFEASLGTAEGVRLAIEGTGPDRDDLTWLVRWREAGAASWNVGEVEDETPGAGFSGQSGFVAAVASLEVAIGYTTGGGATSWSDSETVDASVAEEVIMPGGLTAELDGADVVVSFSIAEDHGRVFRGGATDVWGDPGVNDVSGELPATPGVPIVWTDPAPAAGTYRYWAVAETAADAPSDPAGPVQVTVP